MSDQETEPGNQPPLRLVDLHISAGPQMLLADTNVTIPGGKITVIVGGSGAGKSVLLRTLAGLLPRQGETLAWGGTIDMGRTPVSSTEMSPAKRVGIVFQQFALFDELSPTENVQFAIDHRSNRNKPPSQTAAQWLSELGVPAQDSSRRFERWSKATIGDRPHTGGRSGHCSLRRTDIGLRFRQRP